MVKSTNYKAPHYTFFHPTVSSCLLTPNIPFNIFFSYALNLFSALGWETKFHTHTKLQISLQFCIF
jgi:hypothetical protein